MPHVNALPRTAPPPRAVTAAAQAGIDVVVAARRAESDGVASLLLRRPDGEWMPQWAPGAHVDAIIEGQRVRQYSLTGDPRERDHYMIGVLREPSRDGTSRFIHDRLAVGSRLRISPPRNHFALQEARRYVFIAGGIGITPIIPMLMAVDRAGLGWTLLYGGRSRASMAFCEHLSGYGARVEICPEDEVGRPDLELLLATPGDGTLVYCCGPEGLLQAVERHVAHWPAGSLHTERFAPACQSAAPRDEPFELVLRSSGLSLIVPPNRSILSVVEEAGIAVACSCEAGVCGSCEAEVIDGIPDHRDAVLGPGERAKNDCIMICVSRSHTPVLVLDL